MLQVFQTRPFQTDLFFKPQLFLACPGCYCLGVNTMLGQQCDLSSETGTMCMACLLLKGHNTFGRARSNALFQSRGFSEVFSSDYSKFI